MPASPAAIGRRAFLGREIIVRRPVDVANSAGLLTQAAARALRRCRLEQAELAQRSGGPADLVRSVEYSARTDGDEFLRPDRTVIRWR
jgi:hypothetical protein